MDLNPRFRAVIRTSVCVAAWVGVSLCFGAPAGRRQIQAQVLDHAEILCANCFFGPSDYYYCFATDDKILIGYQRTPVLNWRDQSKNYLTPAHQGWAAWAAPGQSVPIGYDDKHIWVSRADSKPVRRGLWGHVKLVTDWISRVDSKQVKLKRSASRDIFTNNDRCRGGDSATAR